MLLLAVTSAMAQTQVASVVSESDFLSDMPIVLSVSRLPQRLDETPGAVTILDRDMIRRSGARDVADLLRLVPGFQVSNSFESVAPLVSYHGAFSSYSNRLELLIDGRSVYSPYFIGSIGPGLQTVALQDIERIEVLRGSNSAAYGARAFLGVINIVTRDTFDTLGPRAGVTVGENGIRDTEVSLGWGDLQNAFRLTADTRGDDGLAGSNGRNRVSRVNLRSDLRPNGVDEVQLRLGVMNADAGKGLPGEPGNPWRDFSFGSNYAQLDWRRTLSADVDLALKLSHNQETYSDAFDFALPNLCTNLKEPNRTICFLMYKPSDIYIVNAGGSASSDTVSLQTTWRQSPTVRMVLGGEYRRENVRSPGLYNTDAVFVKNFTRLFGNLEWRATPTVLVNAGALTEHDSVSGDTLAPRLMVNWHMTPGQTWRAGFSKAFRPPSTFENFTNVHYIWPVPPYSFDKIISRGPGNLQPEQVLSREVGYMGDFPALGVNLDVRIFDEQVTNAIWQFNKVTPFTYVNSESFTIRGLEYQLKWQPWQGAQFIVNQTYTDINARDQETTQAAPQLASSIAYFQKLPGQWDFTLTHLDNRSAVLMGSGANSAVAITRTDLRLAKNLRWGSHRGELALVLQNLGSPYPDYKSSFYFGRQAFITLRLEN